MMFLLVLRIVSPGEQCKGFLHDITSIKIHKETTKTSTHFIVTLSRYMFDVEKMFFGNINMDIRKREKK